MTPLATVAVPGQISELAQSAVSRVSRIHFALGRFAAAGRLEGLPDEIDLAIKELRALRPTVGDLRVAVGLRRNPPKKAKQKEVQP